MGCHVTAVKRPDVLHHSAGCRFISFGVIGPMLLFRKSNAAEGGAMGRIQPRKLQYNLNSSNPDGSFTLDDSNSFFSPYKILPIAQENKYLGMFFLFYYGIVCCVYSLVSPNRGDSNEYTQHTIIVYKIEKISLNYRYLLPELVPWLTLSGSNHPYLERISMVPRMFGPLRFDYTQLYMKRLKQR